MLQTDAWVQPQSARWLLSVGPFKALAWRYHGDLATANVRSLTPDRLVFDVIYKL
jgi:hypothetical protein